MKIEAGKYYENFARDNVKCISIDPMALDPYCAVVFTDTDHRAYNTALDGRHKPSGADSRDIIAEWTEPITVSGWVNVDQNGDRSIYSTKDLANHCASPSRVALIFVSGTEVK